jgi:tetratricopeptide (TPR) repeat protein
MNIKKILIYFVSLSLTLIYLQEANSAYEECLPQNIIEYDKSGDIAKAIALADELLAKKKKELGEHNVKLSHLLAEIAFLYYRYQNYEQALKYIMDNWALANWVQQKESFSVATAMGNRGAILTEFGKYKEAEDLLDKAEKLFKKFTVEATPEYVRLLYFKGRLYYHTGKTIEAQTTALKAFTISEQNGFREKSSLCLLLANIYCVQGKYAQAEDFCNRLIKINYNGKYVDHPFRGVTLASLAEIYYQKKQFREAEETYKEALGILEKKLYSGSPLTQKVKTRLKQIEEHTLMESPEKAP